MTSTRDMHTKQLREEMVVEESEIAAAQNDPRVQAFLKEADAYIIELEQHGRNH